MSYHAGVLHALAEVGGVDPAHRHGIAFVEDGVDLLFVVSGALGEAPHLGSGSGRISVHVLSTIRRQGGRSKEPLLLI